MNSHCCECNKPNPDDGIVCTFCEKPVCGDCLTEVGDNLVACDEHAAQEVASLLAAVADMRNQRDEQRMIALQREEEKRMLETENAELRERLGRVRSFSDSMKAALAS
jgi:hypothetical protein